MAKVIIGIHGLGNKPPKNLLEKWWNTAIFEGFGRQGISIPNYKFELVYWADLVYDKPESLDITDEESPYFLDEPYSPSAGITAEIKDLSFRKKVLYFIEDQLEKVFLNDDYTLNYHMVSDAIMHKYFRELEMYYGNDEEQRMLKKHSRDRLTKVLKKYKYDDVLLIGHSMGSIIAYDVLQFELSESPIHTFITMGSPIGLPFIRAKIANELKNKDRKVEINTPTCVSQAWYNFADLEDKVALNFELRKHFLPNSKNIQVEDLEIINDYEINGERNPHKSFGYLRSAEFIQKLNVFLLEKKKRSITNWFIVLQRLATRIKY